MRFIPIKAAQPGMLVGRDINLRSRAAMLTKGSPLTPEYIEYLKKHGYAGLYISDRVSEDIEVSETISQSLFDQGVDAIAEENIGMIINSSMDIVNEISAKEEVHVDLIGLHGYDEYTFHHSVNVATYSVIIGKKMNLSKEQLQQLSIAALSFDMGKMEISEDILNKPGSLTPEEFEIVKQHPRTSVEIFEKKSPAPVPSVIKNAILLHHENENGTGYPMGISGDQIPLFAKIIHVCDVYDALTCKRVYKDAYPPNEALEYLRGGAGILFDKEVVEAALQVLPAYPPGISVILSDHREAIVYSHTSNAMRPKVKILATGEVLDLSLSGNSELSIAKAEVMPTDYVSEVETLVVEGAGPKPKILVVDDMMLSLVHAKKILSDDYEVITEKSGEDALKYTANYGFPDLLIVDIEMPEMNGDELLKELKKRGMDKTPVMFLTAHADRSTVIRCLSIGAQDYVAKPVNPIYLKERVSYLLERWGVAVGTS